MLTLRLASYSWRDTHGSFRVFVPSIPPASPSLALSPGSSLSYAVMEGSAVNSSSFPYPWKQLPSPLQLHILSFLPANDRALSGRLVSPDAADALREPQHCTTFLSQPLPPHAVPWAVEAGQQHVRQLPFRHKLQLLCTAAASGSEVNLEVALELARPSVFPEVLQDCDETWPQRGPPPNPGVAAVRAGHLHLLGWLLHRCHAIVWPRAVLEAAAQHCNLAGLQAVWEALQVHPRMVGRKGEEEGREEEEEGEEGDDDHAAVLQALLDAAAGSATADAVAKMEWLRGVGGAGCSLKQSTVEAAARSGDVGRLRWLQDHGCPVGTQDVLCFALQHADLAVAQWLADEAGCALPAEQGDGTAWECLMYPAARSPSDAVAKLQWLHERGSPPPDTPGMHVLYALGQGGQVEVLRYLQSLPGFSGQQDLWKLRFNALRDGNMPMLEQLHAAGVVLAKDAYSDAAASGSLAMVQWLVREAKAPAAGARLDDVIENWPQVSTASSRDLLQAVQLLVEEAGCTDWVTKDAVYAAADRGDLALVRYLLQQRPQLVYQPDGDTAEAAVKAGCEALLEWLAGQPGWSDSLQAFQPYITAAARRDRGTLGTLRRLGVPWEAGGVVAQAVGDGCQVPALRWLVEHGAPVGSGEEMEQEIGRRRLPMHYRYVRPLREEDEAWLRGLAAAEDDRSAVGSEPTVAP